MHLLSFEESVKMAYIPVLLTKAAFRYAEMVATMCAQNRLPYVKEVREIRKAIGEYHSQSFGNISSKALLALENETEEFFDMASTDVQTLWFVVNQELKTRYPELDKEYDLLTYLCIGIAMLRYVRKFEIASDTMLSRRMGEHMCCAPNKYSLVVWKMLEKIADNHKVDGSDMINLSLRIIRKKADELLENRIESFKQIKENNHENQGQV